MRLICPNCEAQYEVPSEVIPEGGRDVQCSNCGDTWFQHHPDHMPPDTAEDHGKDSAATDSSNDEDSHAVEEVETSRTEPEDDSPPSEENDLPKRQELEPSVTDILREEATLEEATRSTETENRIETQPDLGISQDTEEDHTRHQQIRERMERLQDPSENIDTDDETQQAADLQDLQSGSRRDLLPNIEEITSSLSSADGGVDLTDTGTEIEPGKTKPSSGAFLKGFLYAVLFTGLATAIYIFAPALESSIPALKGPLGHYTDMISTLRGTLNEHTGGIREWLQQMASVPE